MIMIKKLLVLVFILSIINFYLLGNIIMALIAGALLIIYFGTGIIITRRANRNIYKETEKEAYKIDAGGHSDEERVEYIRERDELNPDNKLKKVSVQLLLINYFAKSGCKVLMVVGIAMRILLLI